MNFQRNIWVGFLSALAIIAWLAITAYRNNQGTRQSLYWVAHANLVLFHSEQILSLIVDLESGQRGYALTGITDFLEPTWDAFEKVESHASSLGDLTSDNVRQLDRANRLKQRVMEKLRFTRDAIQARKTGGLDSARAMNASMQGKKLTDQIRQLIGEIQEEEKQLLATRTEAVQARVERFNNYFVAMLAVTGLILVLLFYAILLNNRARARAQNSLEEAIKRIEDIYNNAPCGYHSVTADNTFVEINTTFLNWLGYSKEEVVNKLRFRDVIAPSDKDKMDVEFAAFKEKGFVRDVVFDVVRKDGTTFTVLVNSSAVYDDNHNFIKSRSTVLDYTEQKKSLQRIEQLNQELESFSYSVSHDLRAPLRSIDGYTQILMEDYSPGLDDEGKRLLNVVVNNARRMGRLIDDLLDFSRISRKDIARVKVNNLQMVDSILSELRASESGRTIEIKVDQLEECLADPNLLRQVWYNLLSNALKYTRKREIAYIEIWSEQKPGEIVYAIKDNGTGFDMQYVGKLFGVFQRLHRQTEFEGTGVGLAIVHRIITRHGGTVWAIGEVEKGATFFFSLPNT